MLNFGKQILTKKINKLGLLVLLGLSAGLIYLLLGYSNPIRVTRLSGLDPASLPTPWPSIFSSPHAMRLWLYVNISGKEIKYFAQEDLKKTNRASVVIASIKEIIESRKYKIPDGIYLFNLGDITRDDYPSPILAFTAKKIAVENKKVVLIPDNRALKGHAGRFAKLDAVMQQYPWDTRKNIIFWRGKATGGKMNDTEIAQVPRLRFMQVAKNLKFVDAGITNYPVSLNPKLKSEAEQMFSTAKYAPIETALGYKYLMDIDGHSCSFDRMAWILYSESVLFKQQSDQVQWYYKKLTPWVHYVPVSNNFSNLSEMYNWIEAHPELAKDIAINSKKFSQDTFSHDAVLHSLATGMQEYQQLISAIKLQLI